MGWQQTAVGCGWCQRPHGERYVREVGLKTTFYRFRIFGLVVKFLCVGVGIWCHTFSILFAQSNTGCHRKQPSISVPLLHPRWFGNVWNRLWSCAISKLVGGFTKSSNGPLMAPSRGRMTWNKVLSLEEKTTNPGKNDLRLEIVEVLIAALPTWDAAISRMFYGAAQPPTSQSRIAQQMWRLLASSCPHPCSPF